MRSRSAHPAHSRFRLSIRVVVSADCILPDFAVLFFTGKLGGVPDCVDILRSHFGGSIFSVSHYFSASRIGTKPDRTLAGTGVQDELPRGQLRPQLALFHLDDDCFHRRGDSADALVATSRLGLGSCGYCPGYPVHQAARRGGFADCYSGRGNIADHRFWSDSSWRNRADSGVA